MFLKDVFVLKQKETDKLLKALKTDAELSEIMSKHEDAFLNGVLSEELKRLLEKKQITRRSLIKASLLNEVYFYQILNGRKRPHRNKLLCITIAMQLTVDETQELLKVTGYAALYPRLPQDYIIIYGIERGMDVTKINELLFEHGFSLLTE